uniref:Uncharacterized protein n=1 Tax=Arundo donax TaxID=35708 RepID=A0A0A9AQK9_ARUDO
MVIHQRNSSAYDFSINEIMRRPRIKKSNHNYRADVDINLHGLHPPRLYPCQCVKRDARFILQIHKVCGSLQRDLLIIESQYFQHKELLTFVAKIILFIAVVTQLFGSALCHLCWGQLLARQSCGQWLSTTHGCR